METTLDRIRIKFRIFARSHARLVHSVEHLGNHFTIENQKLDNSEKGLEKRSSGNDTYYLKHKQTILAIANDKFEVELTEAFKNYSEVLDFI